MPRYIDADALMQEYARFVAPANNSDFADVPTWNDAVSLLGSAPTADVVEVVRCKDCKWYEHSLEGNPWGGCNHKNWTIGDYYIGFEVDADGYCYRGERRGDGDPSEV